jgi:hypothetical protein
MGKNHMGGGKGRRVDRRYLSPENLISAQGVALFLLPGTILQPYPMITI